MLTWDDAKTFTQREAHINTADTDGVTFLDLMTNQGYKQVLARLGRQVTEKVKTASTVADQREYQVPPDAEWVKGVSITVGSTKYLLREIQSEEIWDYRTQNDITGIPNSFFYRPRFGVGGGIIELDPIPGGVYTIRLTTEVTERDLSQTAYTTGTITLTANSTTVTGVGTTFTADMVGRYLRATSTTGDRLWYRIGSYTSATVIGLEQYYHGSTQAGLSYKISEVFALPEDAQMLPCYFALWQWFESKQSVVTAARWEKAWNNGLKASKKTHSQKTRDNIIHYDLPTSPFEQAMPSYFSSEVS